MMASPNRLEAQQRVASDELDRLSLEVAATGSGLRNPTLNRAAYAIGRLVGAGAISRAVAEKRLAAAGVCTGLSQSEAQRTTRSGLDAGEKKPSFALDRDAHAITRPPSPAWPQNRDSATERAYQALMHSVVELCPMGGDAAAYLRSRGLPIDASPDMIALPAVAKQPALLAELEARHGRDAVLASGLADATGSRLQWPEHRLGFIWRNAITGHIATLQRRYLGKPPKNVPKPVFAKGRKVTWPWAAHLLRDVPRDVPVAIVEGVLDWIAWRALYPFADAAPCIALDSAHALKPEWLALLAGRQVFVALDGDDAGESASTAIIEQLSTCATPLRIKPWPGCKDWADRLDPRYRAEPHDDVERIAIQLEGGAP